MATREERRKARLDRLERLTPAQQEPQLVPPEAVPIAKELRFLQAVDDPADEGRRSLLALRLHALLPLPGHREHPDDGLREHLARMEAKYGSR